jgi:hypothetical protein
MANGQINIQPIEALIGNYGKSLEKFALYVVGILTQVNIIPTTSGTNKDILLGAVGAILTGLHISTPTPKSGPNQL